MIEIQIQKDMEKYKIIMYTQVYKTFGVQPSARMFAPARENLGSAGLNRGLNHINPYIF